MRRTTTQPLAPVLCSILIRPSKRHGNGTIRAEYCNQPFGHSGPHDDPNDRPPEWEIPSLHTTGQITTLPTRKHP